MSGNVEICSFVGLDPRISILRCGHEVDAMFVRTTRFNALIDTLGTPAACRSAIEKLGAAVEDRPLIVVNSHMDWDHFWGNAAVAGTAPIIGHGATLERLRDPATAAKLQTKAAQEARFRDVEIVGPSITFLGDLTLNGGDLTLELLHTPGHTPDHVAVWIPEIATLLPVDAVEDPVPCVWNDDPESLLLLRASLLRLKDLGAKTVVPAHGRTTTPNAIDRNIAYFDALTALVGRIDRKVLRKTPPEALEGLAFEDLLPHRREMDAEETEFYRNFHLRNLRAAIRSHLETIEIA